VDRLKKINARLDELKRMLDEANDEKSIEEIEREAEALTKERAALIEKMKAESRVRFETARQTEMPSGDNAEERAAEQVRTLMQNRAITIATPDILRVNVQDPSISPLVGLPYSSLVDRLTLTNAIGAETFQKAFMKNYGTASYTNEGQQYPESDPAWDFVTISKAKIAIYTEVSEEFEKLAPSMYLAEIKKNLAIAIKRQLSTEVILGAGTINALTGIVNAPNNVINPATNLPLGAIDENTLDEIVFNYGGPNDFTDGVLILNKLDLLAFSRVRGQQDLRKVYNIDLKNQTIDGVPYILNNALPALSNSNTPQDAVCILYGSLSAYTLAVFSNIEIMKSVDFRFRQGQIAYKASGFFGGNVTQYNGFLRVRKQSSSS